MPSAITDIEELLGRAGRGDSGAISQLLGHHRDRLKRMVAVHLDRRLAARVDPSDVVQEALTEAARKLPVYLSTRPLAFYPWLRQLTKERLSKLHHRPIRTGKRSVNRETAGVALPDDSALRLVGCLVVSTTGPLSNLARAELCAPVVTLRIIGLPSSTHVGQMVTFTVTLFDAFGNVATGYRGTVHFTSTDHTAILPVDDTFTAQDAGSHVFSVVFRKKGVQRLTASDTQDGDLSDTESTQVLP
jgi:hypothetical protein